MVVVESSNLASEVKVAMEVPRVAVTVVKAVIKDQAIK